MVMLGDGTDILILAVRRARSCRGSVLYEQRVSASPHLPIALDLRSMRSADQRRTLRVGPSPAAGQSGRLTGSATTQFLSLTSARIRQSRVRGLFGQLSHANPRRPRTRRGAMRGL